jgi:pyridoxamine 5'-phosphate oxidase
MGARVVTPLERAAAWLDEARSSGAPEPEAMALATAAADGTPSVRMVLCRGIDARGLRFFTNYESRKGRELSDNPRAAVVFYWAALGRQLRAEGDVERLSSSESDAYFAGRPRGHRLSAHASPQSRPIVGLDEIRERAESLQNELVGRDVPRPPFWGGYRLVPRALEFWVQGADRLHDRVRFELHDGAWRDQRLAP